MIDPIGTAASTVTIIDRMTAIGLWFRRRIQRKKGPLFPNYDVRDDFELKPIKVRIDLLAAVPYIELDFYAVNYHKRQLKLTTEGTEIENLTCGSMVDKIPLYQEYILAPKSTSLVIFRRKLLDSEARVLEQMQLYNPVSASFSLHAQAKHKRKEYVYGPVSSRSIDGWVNKK
jgi:hypothetical protein